MDTGLLWHPAALIALGIVLMVMAAALSATSGGNSRPPYQGDTTRRPAIAAGRPFTGQHDTRTIADAVERRHIKYRTRDGSLDYGFSMVRFEDGDWRVYITSQPTYNGRASGSHATHRLTDPEGHRFICWSCTITSYQDAKVIAARWAEATEQYRNTGNTF